MTLDIKNMTQTEFDNFMADLKVNNPNLFQFIVDFINKKSIHRRSGSLSKNGA